MGFDRLAGGHRVLGHWPWMGCPATSGPRWCHLQVRNESLRCGLVIRQAIDSAGKGLRDDTEKSAPEQALQAIPSDVVNRDAGAVMDLGIT